MKIETTYPVTALPEEYKEKFNQICDSFYCTCCPLDKMCPKRLTLEMIDQVYKELFTDIQVITEEDLNNLFRKD